MCVCLYCKGNPIWYNMQAKSRIIIPFGIFNIYVDYNYYDG